MDIVQQEASLPAYEGVRVLVPDYMAEIVTTLSHLARQSPQINQRSGVSVRMSVTNFEALVANALRRTLRQGEADVVPRVCDLDALAASTSGKVEFETLDEGRESEILDHLVRAATLAVFKAAVPPDTHRAIVDAFDDGIVARTGDDVSVAEIAALADQVPSLKAAVDAVLADEDIEASPGVVASVVEFVLEGLHLSKRLNKDRIRDGGGQKAQYRKRS